MALFKPDYQMKEAQEYIDSLGDDPNNILIKYYIDKKQADIDELRKRLKEYRDWFNKLDRFLPNKNMSY